MRAASQAGVTEDAGGSERRTTLIVAAVAVLALIGGVGIGAAVWGTADTAPGGDTTSTGVVPDEPAVASAPAVVEDAPTQPQEPSTSVDAPVEAVERFLAAEIAGELERSFALLSASTQQAFGPTVERWTATHSTALPPITSYDLVDSTADGDQARVTTVVEFEPSLDEVRGLVPGQARVAWAAVEEDDAWRVDLVGSVMEPILPPDDGAAEAVRAWVEGRQECRDRAPGEPLPLGALGLAAEVCGTEGPVTVGELTTLAVGDAAPFQTAYGEEISSWARVVPVAEPVGMGVVVVPVGEEWTVIGVLPEVAE